MKTSINSGVQVRIPNQKSIVYKALVLKSSKTEPVNKGLYVGYVGVNTSKPLSVEVGLEKLRKINKTKMLSGRPFYPVDDTSIDGFFDSGYDILYVKSRPILFKILKLMLLNPYVLFSKKEVAEKTSVNSKKRLLGALDEANLRGPIISIQDARVPFEKKLYMANPIFTNGQFKGLGGTFVKRKEWGKRSPNATRKKVYL